MSRNLDDFANILLFRCKRRASCDVARYVFENKRKSLDEIVQGCVQNDTLKSKTERFAQDVNKIILGCFTADHYSKSNFLEEREKFTQKCRNEILKKAIAEEIPLREKGIYDNWFSTDYRNSHLNLEGLDDYSSVKECLKWINCVTEVYCGKPMFSKGEHQNINFKNSQSIQNKNTSSKESGEKDQEEDSLYNAWIQGYLQCDLMSR